MGVLATTLWNRGYRAYPLPVATAVGVNRPVLQPLISTHKALECPRCHYEIPKQNLQEISKTWLKVYESSFLYFWLLRLARKGGRNLVGHTLDAIIPMPNSLKGKLKRWLQPMAKYYEPRCWSYTDLVKRYAAKKPLRLSEYWNKTIVNMRVWGTFKRFHDGEIFWGIARLLVLGLTWYDVGKYLYRAYKNPQERKKNLKKCLIQAIKWTIGTEIGNIGFDIGMQIAPKIQYWEQTGLLMEALWSATFDRLLHKQIHLEQ